MPQVNQGSKLLRIGELLYLILIAIAFYFLIASRTGEADTVWQVLQPAFIPTLLIATFFLFTILFASEKTTYKLLLVILYSILIHSFFSIIFPAGDNSGQQMVLGLTRRVYDNTVLHGLSGWPTRTIGIFIVEALVGTNLQAALTTIFARMLSVDIIYVHLSYMPVLWGVFVPIASYLTTKTVSGSEKAAVLSSLLVSAFPYTIYFGAISVPNSLGFIFFFFSLYFMLKYLSSNDSRNAYWMLAFSLFTFLSHDLTGVMAFSFLLLAVVFKKYEKEKKSAPTDAKILLIISFLICVSLLPLSFIYLKFFGTSANPAFTLSKFYDSSPEKIIGLFLLGELANVSDSRIVFLTIIGAVVGFAYMIYLLYSLKTNPTQEFRKHVYFLFLAFLAILIDYRILKLFMTGLPLNAERLWVLRDLIAAPFAALAVYAVVSWLHSLRDTMFPSAITFANLKPLPKGKTVHVLCLIVTLNFLIPLLLGGWMVSSPSAAYPQVAQLQITSYELEAVKYIEQSTWQKYVVIGDIWTTYAGEVIVGINNPNAYYFSINDAFGHDLFVNMSRDPSPGWMLSAMNFTQTTVAYFIITQPRVGTTEFNTIVSQIIDRKQLTIDGVFGDGKLYVFGYRKE
jgi:hypothetical protein